MPRAAGRRRGRFGPEGAIQRSDATSVGPAHAHSDRAEWALRTHDPAAWRPPLRL